MSTFFKNSIKSRLKLKQTLPNLAKREIEINYIFQSDNQSIFHHVNTVADSNQDSGVVFDVRRGAEVPLELSAKAMWNMEIGFTSFMMEMRSSDSETEEKSNFITKVSNVGMPISR